MFLNDQNIFQPDILFIANKNIKGIKFNGFHGTPDLVIEILSASNAQYDLIKKKRVYERCKVKEFWVIDPVKSEAKGYYLAGGKYYLLSTATGKVQSKIWKHTFTF